MLDQILQLIEAGFKADQIMQLISNNSAPAAPDPVPPAPAAPVPGAADLGNPANPGNPNPAPAAAPVPPAPAPAGIDAAAISAAIEQMGKNIISALQKAQIGGTPAPAPADPMAQIDAITAQIINPTHKKEE